MPSVKLPWSVAQAMSRVSLRIIICCGVMAISTLCVGYYAGASGNLSPKDARRLIAKVAGAELSTDAVRIKEISSMGASAVVVAQVETAFRLDQRDGKWRVAEIRTGDGKWEDVDLLVNALNQEKAARARAEMESMAAALEAFRKERGTYLESDSQSALIDNLSPRFISLPIRLDPWHMQYAYKGSRNGYLLRSYGIDKRPDTEDDIVVSK
jgi:Type II secretion system (T2SS), protein G